MKDIAKSVTPMPGYLTVTPYELEQTMDNGLELPDSSNANTKPQLGIVLKHGGELMVENKVENVPCETGDVIAYKKYMGHVIKRGIDEVQVISFDDVIAKLDLQV